MENKELYHWGVKGMKWGVRKDRKNRRGMPDEDSQSDDHKQSRDIAKKHVSQMSNKELEALNRRLQLEQTYANLNPKKVSKGRKIVEDVLSEVAKDTAKSVLTYAMSGGNGKKPPIVELGERAMKWATVKTGKHSRGLFNLSGKLTD